MKNFWPDMTLIAVAISMIATFVYLLFWNSERMDAPSIAKCNQAGGVLVRSHRGPLTCVKPLIKLEL